MPHSNLSRMSLLLFSLLLLVSIEGTPTSSPTRSPTAPTNAPTDAPTNPPTSSPTITAMPYVFGQSAPFHGNEADLGTNMRDGTLAAFHRFNARGGIWGRTMELISKDDEYHPAKAINNTRELIAQNVLGLVSYVGTETVIDSLLLSDPEGIPMIAPQTGSRLFRLPANRTSIHIRASYDEEIYAWVAYCQSRGITLFSVFYEDDPFGRSGLDAVNLILGNQGIHPLSVGSYPEDTVNVSLEQFEAVGVKPQAIIMVGTHVPLSIFVAKAKARWPDVILFSVSFIGSEMFLPELIAQNVTQEMAKDIFVGQVMPIPQNLSFLSSVSINPHHALLLDFARAMNDSCPNCSLTFGALEGYLAGTFCGEILLIMGEFDGSNPLFQPYLEAHEVTNISVSDPLAMKAWREYFLDTVYRTATLNIDGLQLGPWRENVTCPPNYIDCFQPPAPACAQGMQNVFLTQPDLVNLTYVELFDWRLETPECNVRSKPVREDYLPLVFGQLAAFTGESKASGIEMSRGIWAAFTEANLSPRQGVHSRKLLLLSYDDEGQNHQVQANARNILETQSVYAIVGSTGIDTILSAQPYFEEQEVPVIGPQSGLRSLQDTDVLNVRAQFDDECAAMVNHALANNWRKISLLYQDDIFGLAGYDGMNLAMVYHRSALFSSASYPHNGTVQAAFNNLTQAGIPNMVVLFTTAHAGAAFVNLTLNNPAWANTTFFAVSYTGVEAFQSLLPSSVLSSGRVLMTLVVPPLIAGAQSRVGNSYIEALQQYDPALTPTHTGLEGYITGRLIIFALTRVDEVSRENIMDELQDPRKIVIDDIELGPFTQSCNLGSRTVYKVQLGVSGMASLGSYRVPAPNPFINDCGAYSLQSDEYFECPAGYAKRYNDSKTLASICELCLNALGCVLPLHQTNTDLRAAMLSLNVIGFVICVALVALVIKYRDTVTFKAVSPPFCLLMLAGAACGYISIFVLYPAPNYGNCMAQVYLLNTAFCLMYASLFAKVFRVTQIFKPRKTQTFRVLKIQDSALFSGVVSILAVELIYCIVWHLVDPQVPTELSNGSELYYTCRSESPLWVITDLLVNASVLFYGILLSFQSRKIPTVFNEAKFVAATMYNTMIIGAIAVLAGDLLSQHDDHLYMYKSLGVFVVFTVAMGLLICSKFPSLWKEVRHNRPPVFKKDSSSTKEGEGNATTTTGSGNASAPNSRVDIKITSHNKSFAERDRGRSSAVDRERSPHSQSDPASQTEKPRNSQVAKEPAKESARESKPSKEFMNGEAKKSVEFGTGESNKSPEVVSGEVALTPTKERETTEHTETAQPL